jgi:hypothetical protein
MNLMPRYFVLFVSLFFFVSSAFAEEHVVHTRFGILKTKDIGMDTDSPAAVYYNNQLLTDKDEDGRFLNVEKKFRIGNTDVILISDDSGGTNCPTLYFFVTTSRSEAKISPKFGTCNDLSRVKRTADSISIVMNNFMALHTIIDGV